MFLAPGITRGVLGRVLLGFLVLAVGVFLVLLAAVVKTHTW